MCKVFLGEIASVDRGFGDLHRRLGVDRFWVGRSVLVLHSSAILRQAQDRRMNGSPAGCECEGERSLRDTPPCRARARVEDGAPGFGYWRVRETVAAKRVSSRSWVFGVGAL